MNKHERIAREKLLSWFAYLVGGWDASQGVHSGRLTFDVDINDDEAVARYILNQFEEDVKRSPKCKHVALK